MSSLKKYKYEKMTVKELKAELKNNGVKGYSKLNKPDLLTLFYKLKHPRKKTEDLKKMEDKNIKKLMELENIIDSTNSETAKLQYYELSDKLQKLQDRIKKRKPTQQIEQNNFIIDKKKGKKEQMNDIIRELENIEREISQIYKNVSNKYPHENRDNKPIIITKDTQYDRYLNKTLDSYKVQLYKYLIPTPIFNKDVYEPSMKLYDRAFKLIDIGTKLTPLFNKSIDSKFIVDIIKKGYEGLQRNYNYRKRTNEKYNLDVMDEYATYSGLGFKKK